MRDMRLMAENVTPGGLVSRWRNDAAVMRRLGQESLATAVETLATDLEVALGTSPGTESAPEAVPAVAGSLAGVEEAAEVLGMSVSWLYRHRHELPFARKIGSRLLFDREGMAAWTRSQGFTNAA